MEDAIRYGEYGVRGGMCRIIQRFGYPIGFGSFDTGCLPTMFLSVWINLRFWEEASAKQKSRFKYTGKNSEVPMNTTFPL